MDYRELPGEQFDAIASIGMVEHVGAVNIDAYSATLARLLKPGGRLLNHGIARLRHGEAEAGPFSERYVLPHAAPLHLSRIQSSLEKCGFETRHVEGFRMDAQTLREWLRRLEEHHDEAVDRRPGADARLGGLPARRAARVRDELHVRLSGARRPRQACRSSTTTSPSRTTGAPRSSTCARWSARPPRTRRCP